MPIVATITLSPEGILDAHSQIIIDGATYPIPEFAESGGALAPRRIVETLDAAGYRPATNYYGDLGEVYHHLGRAFQTIQIEEN